MEFVIICISLLISLLYLNRGKIFLPIKKVIRTTLKRKVAIKTIVQPCDCYAPDLAVPATVRSLRSPKTSVIFDKQHQNVLYEWSPNFSQFYVSGTCSSEDFGSEHTKFRWVLGKSGYLHLYLISSLEKTVFVSGEVRINKDGAIWNVSSFSGTLSLDDDEGDRLHWMKKVPILQECFTVTEITFEEVKVNVRQLLIQLEHYQELANQLLSLKNGNSTSADLMLKTTAGETFPVHANILAARSTAFADKLPKNGSINAENAKQIEIKNISGAVMSIILKYIYSGEISQMEIQTKEVLSAAHQVSEVCWVKR